MLNPELRKRAMRYLRPFRLPCAPLGPPRWGALGAAEVLACSVSSAFTPRFVQRRVDLPHTLHSSYAQHQCEYHMLDRVATEI